VNKTHFEDVLGMARVFKSCWINMTMINTVDEYEKICPRTSFYCFNAIKAF